mgnify:CR=1 FL=1
MCAGGKGKRAGGCSQQAIMHTHQQTSKPNKQTNKTKQTTVGYTTHQGHSHRCSALICCLCGDSGQYAGCKDSTTQGTRASRSKQTACKLSPDARPQVTGSCLCSVCSTVLLCRASSAPGTASSLSTGYWPPRTAAPACITSSATLSMRRMMLIPQAMKKTNHSFHARLSHHRNNRHHCCCCHANPRQPKDMSSGMRACSCMSPAPSTSSLCFTVTKECSAE